MKGIKCATILLVLVCSAVQEGKGGSSGHEAKDGEKLRVCVVDGRGSFKKSHQYCPILEQTSNIECVIGVDRMDCVRRIHKGSAHFGVFSAEDLVAARWADVQVLVTNEMRFSDAPFEYEIVAVVDNEANIYSPSDIRGAKFCHPGHGLQNHWTEVLANYFESTLVARQCEEDMSLAESRIKASSKFFGPSCKAGPWVADPVEDRLLKSKYPSLCEICYNPKQCAIGDKHWGRRGPLYCLTAGVGEIAWVRLDDVRSHFGFSGLPPQSDYQDYSFLCLDSHLQPLNSSNPCVWVAKPWPAVAARIEYAERVQNLLYQLSHDDENSWQNALLHLLETYHVQVSTLDTTIPIDNYLDQAVGYQGAYSFPSCNPPRSIVYCTTSILQYTKCSWLQEASTVYGIEPNIQCIRTDHLDSCMDDVRQGISDVVLVDEDDRLRAERDFDLKPILYEFSTPLHERYAVVAVIRADSDVRSMRQLENKKACFPSYEGAAFLSVAETLKNFSLAADSCRAETTILDFFHSKSCYWGDGSKGHCDDRYRGDEGALRCLTDRRGDVAFIDMAIWKNFTEKTSENPYLRHSDPAKFKLLCPHAVGRAQKGEEYCYLHWTTRGHVMIKNGTELMRRNEIYNSLRDMDRLFGKNSKFKTQTFTLYGPYDKKNNILFRDQSDGLLGIVDIMKDKLERNMEKVYEEFLPKKCSSGAAYWGHEWGLRALALLLSHWLTHFLFA